MLYLYDDLGLFVGTSEESGPGRTSIPYPHKNGFYRFINGTWELIFGIDASGRLTNDPSEVADPPMDRELNGISDSDLHPDYPHLSLASLDSLFDSAEPLVRETSLCQAFPVTTFFPAYGLYRRGDAGYYGVGFTWSVEDGRNFNAKVVNGVVTDVYELFGPEDPYIWKELDPVSFEPVALYIEGGDKKLDPVTLEVLQTNVSTEGLSGVPEAFANQLTAMGFPFTGRIWQYSNKPYGEVVAFFPE